MSAHTPGPWTCDDVHIGSNFIHAPGHRHIPLVMLQWPSNDRSEHETKANARLIAAAPELLEALENLENDDGSIPDHAWNLCQKAIAKAKGENQ